MPQGTSGIRAGSGDNLILDAGRVYVNIDITALEAAAPVDGTPVDAAVETAQMLGATQGGASFDPGRTLRQIELDGLLGPARGFVRRQRSEPTITANLIETTVENFEIAIAGLITETVGEFTRITGGEIRDEHYLDNVAVVTRFKGSVTPIVIVVHNALVLAAPALNLQHGSEAVLAVTFTGHFDPLAADDEVWAIYHPGVDAA